MNYARSLLAAAIFLALVFAPLAVRGQSALSVSDAQPFLGNWEITVNGPMPFGINMVLVDKAGKVAGDISSDLLGKASVSDITKDGSKLVLKYQATYDGNPISVKLTLNAPADGKLMVAFAVAEPEFNAPGEGKRK